MCMKYCVENPNRWWYFKPKRSWDGKDKSFRFKIHGESDLDYAKCHVTRRIVSGIGTFVEWAAVIAKSSIHNIVAMLVTEANLIIADICKKYMLHIMRDLIGLELVLEVPMVLWVDNSRAVDLANNWSCAGRTRYMNTWVMFLIELKEEEILIVN